MFLIIFPSSEAILEAKQPNCLMRRKLEISVPVRLKVKCLPCLNNFDKIMHISVRLEVNQT